MKVTRLLLITIFLVSSLSQPNTSAQDYTKWGLPEGVTTRLGKGQIREMAFSPDGTSACGREFYWGLDL